MNEAYDNAKKKITPLKTSTLDIRISMSNLELGFIILIDMFVERCAPKLMAYTWFYNQLRTD